LNFFKFKKLIATCHADVVPRGNDNMM